MGDWAVDVVSQPVTPNGRTVSPLGFVVAASGRRSFGNVSSPSIGQSASTTGHSVAAADAASAGYASPHRAYGDNVVFAPTYQATGQQQQLQSLSKAASSTSVYGRGLSVETYIGSTRSPGQLSSSIAAPTYVHSPLRERTL